MDSDATQLGPYKLETRLGAGGMGEVWKAEDTRLRRAVAIKILPPAIAHDAEARGRLVREARTAAQLYHPNIATIHAIEQEGERSYIVMEYVEGAPLAKLILDRALTETDVIRISKAVADALAEAHARGIVHRDIKPDNVIVSGDKVKVLDFGIAKQVGYSPQTSATDATGVVTEAGVILGTIHYMSPEQALGRPLDGRSDIFSLGVVMYEALAGRLPFRGETVTETLTNIIRDEPDDIGRVAPSVSRELADIVRRCLRKNRDERFADARELSQALEAALLAATTKRTVVTPPQRVVTPPRAAAAPTVLTQAREPLPRRHHTTWLWILVPLALIAGIAGAMYFQRANRVDAARTVAAAAPVATTSQTKPGVPAPDSSTSASLAPAATTVTETAAPVIVEKTKAATTTPAPVEAAKEPTAEELYAQGENYRSFGNMKDALASYEAAVQKNPTFAKAHIRLAEAALARRDDLMAAAGFDRALAHETQLSEREVLVARLGASIAREDDRTAKQYIREFETAYPGDPELRLLKREFLRTHSPAPRRRRF